MSFDCCRMPPPSSLVAMSHSSRRCSAVMGSGPICLSSRAVRSWPPGPSRAWALVSSAFRRCSRSPMPLCREAISISSVALTFASSSSITSAYGLLNTVEYSASLKFSQRHSQRHRKSFHALLMSVATDTVWPSCDLTEQKWSTMMAVSRFMKTKTMHSRKSQNQTVADTGATSYISWKSRLPSMSLTRAPAALSKRVQSSSSEPKRMRPPSTKLVNIVMKGIMKWVTSSNELDRPFCIMASFAWPWNPLRKRSVMTVVYQNRHSCRYPRSSWICAAESTTALQSERYCATSIPAGSGRRGSAMTSSDRPVVSKAMT
mmetsp:Transcript_36427/g.93960  ORF Transcript_36427/g.93960 Transcript_36427/m.93960 type:complete len:317 (-) Transcript_36427:1673-2623(-)